MIRKIAKHSLSIISILLVLITVFSSTCFVSYANEIGTDSGGNMYGGGSSSGTASSQQTGYRIYIIDQQGNVISNVIDFLSSNLNLYHLETAALCYYNTKYDSKIAVANNIGNMKVKTYQMSAISANANFTSEWPKPLIYTNTFIAQGEEFKDWFLFNEEVDQPGVVYTPTSSTTPAYKPVPSSEVKVTPGTPSVVILTITEASFNAWKTSTKKVLSAYYTACIMSKKYTAPQALVEITKIGYSSINKMISDAQAENKAFKASDISRLKSALSEIISDIGRNGGLAGMLYNVEASATKYLSSVARSILPVSYATSEGESIPLDQLNISKLIDYKINGKNIFQLNNGVSVETRENGEPSIIVTCCVNDYVVMVEPVYWFQPASTGVSASGGYCAVNSCTYWFYGTVSNYAQFLTSSGFNANPDHYGSMMRKTAASGFLIKKTMNMANPSAAIQGEVELGQKIDLSILANNRRGYGVHAYYTSANIDTPDTHTFDNPNPGPAPDPMIEDPDMPENEQATCVHNIVKVYETENENGDITTNGVYTRQNVPGRIRIEDEKPPTDYELIEWAVLSTYNWGDSWDGLTYGQERLMSGTRESSVDLSDKSNPTDPATGKTLYVRLRRSQNPQVDGDIIIQQSQLTKAVHTDDANIGSIWGDYDFSFNIGEFSPKSHTYYCGGCCGNDEDGYWCPGHTCYYHLSDTHLSFDFGQVNTVSSLQVPNAVNSRLDTKVWKTNPFSKTIATMGINTYNFSHNADAVDGVDLVTVLWRGGAGIEDIPTLAAYKKADIESKYGTECFSIPSALLSNAGNVSKNTRVSINTSLNLDIRLGLTSNSDLQGSASCAHGNSYTKTVYTAPNYSSEAVFGANVAVRTYAGTPKGLAQYPFQDVMQGKMVVNGNNYSVLLTQCSQQIKFYPYIRMTYMTNSLELARLEESNQNSFLENSRYSTYVLSEYESSILPTDAAEVRWVKAVDDSLFMTSAQWSTHKKATDNGKDWNGTNQVLPGGALYQLSTPESQLSIVHVVSYQTLVDNKTREYLSSALSDNEYTSGKIASDHLAFVNDAKEVLDNLRIVQWVNSDTRSSTAWGDGFTENSKSVCVYGGGTSLGTLGLNKASTDSKYYMHEAASLVSYQGAALKDATIDVMSNNSMSASEGDLDIVKVENNVTVYKFFADTSGNVYMLKDSRAGTENIEQIIIDIVSGLKDVNADTYERLGKTPEIICTKEMTASSIDGCLSDEAKIINLRTGIVSNIMASLNRNQGNDPTSSWVSDGKWYNEAFDGMYIVRQTTTLTIGLKYTQSRVAVLDPNLCPVSKGVSDMFERAFLSQFSLNSKSDAEIAKSKPDNYIGTFKGNDLILPNMEEIYTSRKFFIPNVNVQDLTS